MLKHIILDKKVGETPLSCAEAWRSKNPEYANIPLAYAGRLDPMAYGKLLILIGEECKNQTNYHSLDKEYEFSILLGIESDSLDVLGRLKTCSTLEVSKDEVREVISKLTGNIELPYPKFSAKTVQGKPLHMWTLENRLDEISIPTKKSELYELRLDNIEAFTKEEIVMKALQKVNSIPEVTDPKKALGNDFRRVDVRKDWNNVKDNHTLSNEYQVLHLTCTASSGTYMRTLATVIAGKLGTCGLAWEIHRTQIGVYDPDQKNWRSTY